MKKVNVLLAFLCLFLKGITGCCSPYGPWITNSGPSEPIEYWPPRLVYRLEEEIELECYPPPESSVKVRWGNVNITEGNYAIPSAHIKYSKHEDGSPIKMTLFYNSTQMINKVNVSCYSISEVYKSNYTFAIIEQKYPTSNVAINDESDKVKATPGQVVTLDCMGDGNPKASYRFWYNKTEKDIYRMPDSGKKVSFIYLAGTKFQYACEATNSFWENSVWVNSSWVEVSRSCLLLHSWSLTAVALLFAVTLT